MMSLAGELSDALAEGSVVPIIGSGVSAAAAGIPGWRDLIERGLDHATRTGLARPNTAAEVHAQLDANDVTGAAESILAQTVDYVKERKAFDKPVATFQNTQFKLAELDSEPRSSFVALTLMRSCICNKPANGTQLPRYSLTPQNRWSGLALNCS